MASLDARQQTMRTVMKGVAVLMVPMTAWFQSGVFVYWISTNLFGISQTVLLRQPAIRAAAGMPPLPGTAAAAQGVLGMTAAQAAAATPKALGPNTTLSMSGSQIPQPVAKQAKTAPKGRRKRRR